MKKINIIIVFISVLILTGCYENPIDSEQYIKQVYIVRAADKLYSAAINYSDTVQTTFVSIATGGSQLIDKDIQVTLAEADNSNILAYNNKYVADGGTRYQKLPSSSYEIPSMIVQVKAGNVYGRMPLSINTAGLSCDSLYAIPLKISSSSDYLINATDTVLLFSFKLKNQYSATYQVAGDKVVWLNGSASGLPTTLSVTRVLTAVNKNTVRYFNWSAAETTANRATQCLTLTINSDNSVLIKGWDKLVITNGGGTYDPAKKMFSIWYQYKEGTTEYRVNEKLAI